MIPRADWRTGAAALAILATLVAIVGARPYAGSWNDGSRLATAESLVDYGQWSIDRSVFVEPWARPPGAPSPYPAHRPTLEEGGTLDRVQIGGRFYSDKTPVPNLMLAGEYAALQMITGVTAREAAPRVCYWLTIGTSGLAYLAAVIGVLRFARRILGPSWQAAAYSRQVNPHIMLLGVTAWTMECLDRQASDPARDDARPGFGTGLLAGAAYTIDAALGPLTAAFALGVATLLIGRVPWLMVAGALPGMALHHGLNYHVGHVLVPVNMVKEYLLWPGSPFTADKMTGALPPRSVLQTAAYAVSMLVGTKGFLLYSLPTLIVPISIVRLWTARIASSERLLVGASLALVVTAWLVYAVGSSTYSGNAISIRWFVPFLAPMYYVIAQGLRAAPRDWPAFGALSAFGVGLAASAWMVGPWTVHVPLIRLWVPAAVVALAVTVVRTWNRTQNRPGAPAI
jgi:hypothetical protein